MSYTVNITFGTVKVDQSAHEHVHVWVVACERDERGLQVQDCACGARKRVRKGLNGDEIIPNISGPLGDVLFDASQANGLKSLLRGR